MHIFGRRNKEKKDAKQTKQPDVLRSRISSRPILGVNLRQAVSNDRSFDGVAVPAAVRYCIDYVGAYGMELEGIYRVSPNKSRLDELELFANSGEKGTAPNFSDAHEAAGLLKRFLRQLPEHILTPALRALFDAATAKCTCNSQECCTCPAVEAVKGLLTKLPEENYCLLAYVFRHAQLIVQKQKSNKMSLAALGVLLQAMLNLSRNEVRIFLLNASDALLNNSSTASSTTKLFEDVDFKPYVKPKTFEELKAKIPGNVAEVEEEIQKQQNLLQHLQEQAMTSSTISVSLQEDEREILETKSALTLLRQKLNGLKGLPNVNVDELDDEKGDENANTVLEIADLTDNVSLNGNNNDGTNNGNEVNSILLEKQLLAIQTSLKEEIADEKRKITQLLSRLREVQKQLPPDVAQKLSETRHRRTASSVSTASFSSIQNSDSTSNIHERCLAEEKRRGDLSAEVTRLRNLCAELRAHLEHDTVLLSNATRVRPAGGGGDAVPAGLLRVSVANGSSNNNGRRLSGGNPPPIISPKPSPQAITSIRISGPPPPATTTASSPGTAGAYAAVHSTTSKHGVVGEGDMEFSPSEERKAENAVMDNKLTSESPQAKADALLITRF